MRRERFPSTFRNERRRKPRTLDLPLSGWFGHLVLASAREALRGVGTDQERRTRRGKKARRTRRSPHCGASCTTMPTMKLK